MKITKPIFYVLQTLIIWFLGLYILKVTLGDVSDVIIIITFLVNMMLGLMRYWGNMEIILKKK